MVNVAGSEAISSPAIVRPKKATVGGEKLPANNH